MNLKLKHLVLDWPLAALDLESTGVDPAQDRIIDVAVLKLIPGGKPESYHRRVNPGVPIPASASLVHGLVDADVVGARSFREIAQELYRFLKGCDLTGFGITTFDLPLLTAEFARVECDFRVAGRNVLDALDLYRRMEPRDLTNAVRYYLGREHVEAHQAIADVRAALEVLDQQVAFYGLPTTPGELHASLIEVDVARRFRRDEQGRIVFAFGKYTGQPLSEIAERDPDYLEWMLRQSFLDDVRVLVRRALAG